MSEEQNEDVFAFEKSKGGRPPHEPTDLSRKFVEAMLGAGLKQAQVCAVLDITENTLRKHYLKEVECGEFSVHAMVGRSLVFNAIGGPDQDWTKANMSAAIFYAKTRMGWKEPQDEGDTKTIVNVNVRGGLPDAS